MRETTFQQVVSLAYGTLATLYNECSIDKLDDLHHHWLAWLQTNSIDGETWQQCWQRYKAAKLQPNTSAQVA